MPSRAYTSFLLLISLELPGVVSQSVNALSGLYFISTESMFSGRDEIIMGVNALSGLYFISTVNAFADKIQSTLDVSMPSRAYTSFLQEAL